MMASTSRKRKITEDPTILETVSCPSFQDAVFQEPTEDWKETLKTLREQLKTSHKTEAAQRKRLSDLESCNNGTKSQLRNTLRHWNQFDEDCCYLKNRIYPKEYKDLGMHWVSPISWNTYKIDALEARMRDIVQNSGALAFNTLLGLKEQLQHCGAVCEAIRYQESGGCDKQCLEAIVQEQCARLKVENAVFKEKFLESFKSVENDFVRSKVHGKLIVEDNAKQSLELKDKIAELESGISKLRLVSNRQSKEINEVQETFEKYQGILDAQEEEEEGEMIESTPNSSNTASASELDAANYLAEIEKLHKDQETALGSLKQLQFDKNNRILPAVLESVPYKNLAEAVTHMEATVRNEYDKLDNLLGQLNETCGEVIGRSCTAERLELDKQRETRWKCITIGTDIEKAKEHVGIANYENSLREERQAHFEPLEKEETRLLEALKTRGVILKAETDHIKIIYEELLTERGKLRLVDQGMMKRISDLEKWLASHDLPNGDDSLDTGKDVEICEIIDSGASDVTTLKSRLMKAKYERSELQFRLDIFTNKIAPNPLKPPAEQALKAVQGEINHVRNSIKQIKLFLSLQASSISLHREAEKKKKNLEALQLASNSFGRLLDDSRDQNGVLQFMLNVAESELQCSQLLSSTSVPSSRSSDTDDLTMEKNRISEDIDRAYLNHDNLLDKIGKLQDKLQRLHREKVDGIVVHVGELESSAVHNIQTAYCQSRLDKVAVTLQKKSDAILEEQRHQAKLIKKIDRIKLKIEHVSSKKSSHFDEVAQEELQEVKALMMCSLCEENMKDTIIQTCLHAFCWNCVAKVKRCPKCLHAVDEICKLYLT